MSPINGLKRSGGGCAVSTNMPVGMEVTEDTPPDMLTGSMNLKLVLPSGHKIRTSVDRSTPMMDLLVQVTTCHKLSPAAHVLQPYGDRGVLPYKPSTPIGALDTVMVHVVAKSQLAQNQSNKVALKQISQPFEQTHRIQVSLPRNQLYVLRATGRTTIDDIHNEICSEKNLDPTKYSLRHPKELGMELRGETMVSEYKSSQLVLVSNRLNPSNQLSTDDIINALHNINNSSNNNNNKYNGESSSRSLSPDSSVSPVPAAQEPTKVSRKKKPPAPPPPGKKKSAKDGAGGVNGTKSADQTVKGDQAVRGGEQLARGDPAVGRHSRTSSDSSGYHEASLLSESPPSNNSSLPDSLPRRSRLMKETSSEGSQQRQALLSKSLTDLKAPSGASNQDLPRSGLPPSHPSSLRPAQSTTSLNTGRKKRAAPLPPSSQMPPMKTVMEERLNGSAADHSLESVAERSRTLEPQRKASTESVEKCRTLPPGLGSSSVEPLATTPVEVEVEIAENPVAPPDEKDLVMEDDEIDRIFNNATSDYSRREGEGNDSGRESTGSHEPSAVSGSKPTEESIDWEYKLPAPPTFRDPPEKEKDVRDTPRTAIMNELSSVISQRTVSLSKLNEDKREEVLENTSTLDNFKITTYSGARSQSQVRRNNSLIRDTNDVQRSSDEGYVKRSVSHVSLFVRPSDNVKSKTLDRLSTLPSPLRKTNSEFHLNSVGRRETVERPKSTIDCDDTLQSLQVLKSILPQLSRSQGSLNTIEETEPPKSYTAPKQTYTEIPPTYDSPEETYTPKQTSEPPKQTVYGRQASMDFTVQDRSGPVTEHSTSQEKIRSTRMDREDKVAVSFSTWGERPKRQVSIKSDRDYVFGQNPLTADPNTKEHKEIAGPLIKRTEPSDDTKDAKKENDEVEEEPKIKRMSNIYKNLDTGNTKPLRQILTDPNRLPVVRSVELKQPFRITEKTKSLSSSSTNLDKLKERFEDKEPAERTVKDNGVETFESTVKIRERFENAIKERYVTAERLMKKDHSNDKNKTKVDLAPELTQKYESKIKINESRTAVVSDCRSAPVKKYTSVVGIGGSENDVVRVRVKTQNEVRAQVDPRQELLTSIRGFGGLESLKKVRS